MKKEKSLIDTIIMMSEEIILARSAIQVARELKFFTSRLKKPLPHEESISKLVTEMQIGIIKELKIRMASLLQPLVSQYGIDLEGEFWLSSKDLDNGFVPLYKDGKAFLPTHILFLVYHKGDFVSGKIYPGKILGWFDGYKVLMELPSVPVKKVSALYARKIIKKSRYNENRGS